MEGQIESCESNWFHKFYIQLISYKYEIIVFIIIIIGTIFFLVHRTYNFSDPIDASLWGQYGDYIGGVAGTMLAYISIKLLNRNLQEQVRANNLIRENNINSQKIFEIQNFESTFNTLIDLYKDLQDNLKPNIYSNISGKVCNSSKYHERVNEAKSYFAELYSQENSCLASYFRIVYRILQTINDAKVDESLKTMHAKLFRSQLTNDELCLLRYNALSHNGIKMQVYINRYNLLKHMPLFDLLEFKNMSKQPLKPEQQNMLEHLFCATKEEILKVLCNSNNDAEQNIKLEICPYCVNVDFDKINRSILKIQISYTRSSNQLLLSDEDLKKYLISFIHELLFFSSFERYQSIDKINIKSDTITESTSRRHTVWCEVRNMDGYPLVLSQNQIQNP